MHSSSHFLIRLRLILVLLLSVLTLFGFAASPCAAATYYVSLSGSDSSSGTLVAPFLTIQHAINASSNGDTVVVEDGTYADPNDQDLDFGGRSLTVTSQNGPTNTIIYCGDQAVDHRGFYLHSGETNAIISGFYIRDGHESNGGGGGIELSNVDATVQNCIVENCSAASWGGGILIVNGSHTDSVINCTLLKNTSHGGGGVYCFNGGGTTSFVGCSLTGNTADLGGGAGLVLSGGIETLTNCEVTGNTAKSTGGGIVNGGMLNLINCTITGNTSPSGGGLYSNDTIQSSNILTNTIAYGDTGGEIVANQGTATASYCDIQSGYSGTGNINADPLFANAANGNYHLQPTSPCLGSGSSNGAPAKDRDGRKRLNPPSIGEYELGTTQTVPGQFTTIQAAINASLTGDTVLIADGTYSGPGNVDLDFGGRSLTVTSQNGPAKTIIDCGGYSSTDGSGNHRGFYMHSGEANAEISGLTIKNGYEIYASTIPDSSSGGAVEIEAHPYQNMTPVLDNCVLFNNAAESGGGLEEAGSFDYLSLPTGGNIPESGVCSVALSNCTITGNTATTGGGISATVFCNQSLVNCTITGNTASGGSGGGLYSGYDSNSNLFDCTVTSNTAGTDGGGLMSDYGESSGMQLSNCIIAGNTAISDAGGGIYNASGLYMNYCTVTGNAAPSYGGVDTNDPDPQTQGSLEAEDSIFFGDSGGEVSAAYSYLDYCDVQGGYDGTGNINSDPLFVNSPSDLHLQIGSPCTGAGIASGTPGTDKDGKTRSNPPSIGAYEGIVWNTALTVASLSGMAGQTVTLRGLLNQAGTSIGINSKTLTFSVDGTTVGTAATNSNGAATLSYAIPANDSTGSHTITISFAGDNSDMAASGSGTLRVTTPTTLTVPNVSGTVGQTVTLSGLLNQTGTSSGINGETLTFSVDGTAVGTAITGTGGTASLSYAIPANDSIGSHTVTAAFAGDGTYSASSGGGTLTVNAAPPPVGQVRFFPRVGKESRMVGGLFQGSQDNTSWTTLYTVNTTPGDTYTTAAITTDPATFRYLRYLAPNGSYGDVAEIAFYSHGTKLTGTAFGTPGSYNNSGNTFGKALDGSTSTYFDAPAPGNGDFVGIDQGSTGANQVRFYPRAGYPARMVGGLFQGSHDNSTWTTLATVTQTPPASQYSTLPTSADPATFRYLRYLAPNGSYGDVAEVEFDSHGVKLTGTGFGTAGSYNNSGNTFGKALDGSTSTYFDGPAPGNGDYVGIDRGTTYTKLTGTAFGTTGSYNSDGDTFLNAFDGNLSTYVDAPAPGNGDYAGIDLGSGNASVVTRIGYCPRSGYASRLVGGIFQGSNDNATWTALYTVTTAPAGGVLTQTTAISSGTAFRYLRYLAPNGSYDNVAEVEFDTSP